MYGDGLITDRSVMKVYQIFFSCLLCHDLSVNGGSLPADEVYGHIALDILSKKASEIEAFIQAGRKFVRNVKVWQEFHPAETNFGKCVVRYWIDIKIPNIMASDWNEDGRRGLSSSPVWLPETIGDQPEIQPRLGGRTFDEGELDDLKQIKMRAIKALYIIYLNVRDLLSQYRLLNCSLQYLTSKFWEWIDNAP